MTNTNLLKGRIRELGLTQSNVSNVIGISKASFNYKINNKRDFTVNEVMKLCDALSIDNKENYFFCK